jgi:tetratricopeptide (TPR) repeat protein
MNPAQWADVRALLERALDQPREARPAFVRSEAEGDGPLCSAVLRLLNSTDPCEAFLESPLPAVSEDPVASGERVGAYRIVRRIGAGGMGSVYEAAQDRPARRVAVKVLRRGLDSEDSVRRFQLESEVLGLLQHPGIAAIFEAGTHRTDAGEVPYFAMEYVEDARDLLSYARDEQLDVRARIALLEGVCAAVHHGHQKGVIHRDLKPGNLLVDAAGRTKVIDYGVARLADPTGAGAVETEAGGVLGTLAYMSPEQFRGGRDAVDVRTDVYALGVILYELLAARPPHEVAERPLAEAIDEICDATPQAPSTFEPALPRELDWIALKALEKQGALRYGSAAELADDLRRHRSGEPVLAGPPTKVYRLRKLYERHRLLVAAAVGALLALIVGLAVATTGLVRARRAEHQASRDRQEAVDQAEKAGELLSFLERSLAAANPISQGHELTMDDYLRRAAASIDSEFADRPAVRGYLHGVVGNAWAGLGKFESAEPHLQQALSVLRSEEDPDPVELVSSLYAVANTWIESGRYDEAEELIGEARGVLGSDVDDWRFEWLRCRIALERKEPAGVEEALRAVRAQLTSELGPEDVNAVMVGSQLAGLLQEARRGTEAEALYRELLPDALAGLGEESLYVLGIRQSLAMLHIAKGERAAAIEELEHVLAVKRRLLGAEHYETVPTEANLAAIYFLERRFAESSAAYGHCLAALVEQLAADHPALLTLRVNLGTALSHEGRHTEALVQLDEVFALRTRGLGDTHELTLKVRYEVARAALGAGDSERALQLLEEGLPLVHAHLGSQHPVLPNYEAARGRTLAALGSTADARAQLTEVLEDLVAGRRSSEHLSAKTVREMLDEL